MCHANKTHFSRWIKIDTEYPKNIYIFETILIMGIDDCVEICKAKSMCKYVNFKVNGKVCSLIGVEENIQDAGFDPNNKIEKREGYILGKKTDWDLVRF
jgi:hypothetical protein